MIFGMQDMYAVTEADLKCGVAPVPESLKKRIERDTQLLAEKKAALAEKRVSNQKLRAEAAERIEKYDAEYKKAVEDEIAAKRAAKAAGSLYKVAEPKVFFVVRLKGVNKVAPAPRKVLQLFRLMQIHNGVFLKVNKATENMLKHITPFVAFGTVSLSLVRKMIYKRGYLRVGATGSKQRVRIQHNEQISSLLGQYGIHTVEDMVHEIVTCGPNFKHVNKALWAFKLKSPAGGLLCKRHGFAEFRKGDWGNRGAYMTKLVERMI